MKFEQVGEAEDLTMFREQLPMIIGSTDYDTYGLKLEQVAQESNGYEDLVKQLSSELPDDPQERKVYLDKICGGAE